MTTTVTGKERTTIPVTPQRCIVHVSNGVNTLREHWPQ